MPCQAHHPCDFFRRNGWEPRAIQKRNVLPELVRPHLCTGSDTASQRFRRILLFEVFSAISQVRTEDLEISHAYRFDIQHSGQNA